MSETTGHETAAHDGAQKSSTDTPWFSRWFELNLWIMVVLSAVLVFAGIDKLFHYEGFVNALRDYVLVPPGVAVYAAMPLILVEILLGVSVWVKRWRRPALFSIGLLFVVFIAALLVNYHYGRRGICGCWFTFTLAQSNEMHILQNITLAAMAFTVWLEERTAFLAHTREQ